jgi:hypothetical protein
LPVVLSTTMVESASGDVELVAQAADVYGTASTSETVRVSPAWGMWEVWNTIDNPLAWFWVRPHCCLTNLETIILRSYSRHT